MLNYISVHLSKRLQTLSTPQLLLCLHPLYESVIFRERRNGRYIKDDKSTLSTKFKRYIFYGLCSRRHYSTSCCNTSCECNLVHTFVLSEVHSFVYITNMS